MPVYNPRTGENEPDPVNVVEAAPLGTASVDPPEAATVLRRLSDIQEALADELAVLTEIAAGVVSKPRPPHTTTLLHRS